MLQILQCYLSSSHGHGLTGQSEKCCSILTPSFPEHVWNEPYITQDTAPNPTCVSLLLSPAQNLCLCFLLPSPQSPASLSLALLAPGPLFKLPFLSSSAPDRCTFPGKPSSTPCQGQISFRVPSHSLYLVYTIVILRLGYYLMLLD